MIRVNTIIYPFKSWANFRSFCWDRLGTGLPRMSRRLVLGVCLGTHEQSGYITANIVYIFDFHLTLPGHRSLGCTYIHVRMYENAKNKSNMPTMAWASIYKKPQQPKHQGCTHTHTQGIRTRKISGTHAHARPLARALRSKSHIGLAFRRLARNFRHSTRLASPRPLVAHADAPHGCSLEIAISLPIPTPLSCHPPLPYG